MKKIVFSLLFLISHLFLSHAVAQTIREQMSRIETAHKVSFVYDSALPLSSRYTGESLTGLSLEQSLERLFAHTPISYKVQHDGHVLLKAKKTVLEKTTRWTVSGHVRDAQGETLINATVYDLTTHQGTLTNEYGYYSLTLPEGEHQLRITYVGYEQQTVSLKLTQNRVKDPVEGGCRHRRHEFARHRYTDGQALAESGRHQDRVCSLLLARRGEDATAHKRCAGGHRAGQRTLCAWWKRRREPLPARRHAPLFGEPLAGTVLLVQYRYGEECGLLQEWLPCPLWWPTEQRHRCAYQ